MNLGRPLLLVVALTILLTACTVNVPTPVRPRTSITPTAMATLTMPLELKALETTPAPPPTLTPVAEPIHAETKLYFDDVDSRTILAAVFQEHTLDQNGDGFMVDRNPEWNVWLNSRAEGRFLGSDSPQIAAIIAEDRPPEVFESDAWGSFLVILENRADQLVLVAKSFPFPTDLSPRIFDVKIESAVDFDHDGQSELLVTSEATRNTVSTTAGFLLEWNGQSFVEEWSAPIGEDNTAAINQSEYFSSVSVIRLSDSDADGFDEITVETERTDYPSTVQGLADLARVKSRRVEKKVYHWRDTSFVLDPRLSTPLPPLPTSMP